MCPLYGPSQELCIIVVRAAHMKSICRIRPTLEVSRQSFCIGQSDKNHSNFLTITLSKLLGILFHVRREQHKGCNISTEPREYIEVVEEAMLFFKFPTNQIATTIATCNPS